MLETVGTPAETIAAAAEETTLVGGNPSEAIADAAKESEKEEGTLLGKEEKKEETKPETIAPPVKIVPEKYELKAPEGLELDNTAVEKFTPLFKELGLSQQEAQKLVDVYAPYLQQTLEAQKQESLKVFKDMVNEWGEQSKKELGPDYLKKLSAVSKVMDKSRVPGLRELMNETGLGNNPTMIKFLMWVGEQFSQDQLADSGMKKQDNSVEAMAKKLYPTMNQ